MSWSCEFRLCITCCSAWHFRNLEIHEKACIATVLPALARAIASALLHQTLNCGDSHATIRHCPLLPPASSQARGGEQSEIRITRSRKKKHGITQCLHFEIAFSYTASCPEGTGALSTQETSSTSSSCIISGLCPGS